MKLENDENDENGENDEKDDGLESKLARRAQCEKGRGHRRNVRCHHPRN